MQALEWRIDVERPTEHTGLYVLLYEVRDDGQLSVIDAEEFGPFDTATDVTQWIVRHLAPRWRLPLR